MHAFAAVLAIAGFLSLCGCAKPEGGANVTQADLSQPTLLKGVSLSPKSFQPDDFKDFFSKAKEAGDMVSWAGDWNELGAQDGAPAVVSGLAGTYGYTPVIEAQFFSQKDGKLLRPLDAATRAQYKSAAADFAKKYRPRYMGLGIEVNMLYEKSPADFNDFAAFYSEVYDAIKAQSPGTNVFTIFQLEKMKGLHGGFFGGSNGGNTGEWELLDRFPKSDIVAFTTYPGLIYDDPSAIPRDYYAEIRAHTSKPVAFTEVGWHSAQSPPGWGSSETEQAGFIRIFFNSTKGVGEEFAIWSFLYDQSAEEPFNSMGLIQSDGTPKAAFAAWSEAK